MIKRKILAVTLGFAIIGALLFGFYIDHTKVIVHSRTQYYGPGAAALVTAQGADSAGPTIPSLIAELQIAINVANCELNYSQQIPIEPGLHEINQAKTDLAQAIIDGGAGGAGNVKAVSRLVYAGINQISPIGHFKYLGAYGYVPVAQEC